MNIISRTIILLIFSAVLTGCTALPAFFDNQVSQQDKFEQNKSLNDLMSYYDQLQKKKASQLATEYDYNKSYFDNNINADSRFKYILLVSLPNTAFSDIRLALDLLTNWPQDLTLPPDLDGFRKLLISLLEEQQTAKTETRNLSQKLKISNENAHVLKEQIQTLESRIDAIKNMEKHPIRKIEP